MFAYLQKMLSPAESPQEASREERLRIATCVLMLEVAKTDDEFSDQEQDLIATHLRRRFALSEEAAQELLLLSRQRWDESSDLWKFTRAINETCLPAEKMRMMDEIWRIVYADGVLAAHEDYLMHKLAKLLNLNHPQLIAAKMKVLNELRQAPA